MADENSYNSVKDLTNDTEGIIKSLNDTCEFLKSRAMKIQYMKLKNQLRE